MELQRLHNWVKEELAEWKRTSEIIIQDLSPISLESLDKTYLTLEQCMNKTAKQIRKLARQHKKQLICERNLLYEEMRQKRKEIERVSISSLSALFRFLNECNDMTDLTMQHIEQHHQDAIICYRRNNMKVNLIKKHEPRI